MDHNHLSNLIPSLEDPDAMVNPLLHREAMESRYANIDLTVESVGRKITQTPRQHYANTEEKETFKFIRKNRETK